MKHVKAAYDLNFLLNSKNRRAEGDDEYFKLLNRQKIVIWVLYYRQPLELRPKTFKLVSVNI